MHPITLSSPRLALLSVVAAFIVFGEIAASLLNLGFLQTFVDIVQERVAIEIGKC